MDFTHAVVEQLGHRRFVGRVVEEPIAGATMLKVEAAKGLDGETVLYGEPVYLGGGSLFAVTPTTEEAIRGELKREEGQRRLDREAQERWRREHALPAPAGVEEEDEDDGEDLATVSGSEGY